MDRKTLHKASRLSAEIDAYEEYISDIDYSIKDAKDMVITVHMPGSMLNKEIGITDKKQVSSVLQLLRNILARDAADKKKELEEM